MDIINADHHTCYEHQMKLLDDNDCWKLFMKKAFVGDNQDKCPDQDLEKIGREILKNCGGLPLAIVKVAGLLSSQNQSRTKWENAFRQIKSHLEKDVLPTLDLSCQSLSPELKSCFLHLGFFREDATVAAHKLVQVWIAQGLIKEGANETKEDTGEGYLNQLIDRNMVQKKNMSKGNTRVRNCYIHALIRDLSIDKATNEIGFQILGKGRDSQSSGKTRHCAIYGSIGGNSNYLSDKNKKEYTCIRSLFFHGAKTDTIEVKPSYWKSFERLRILDLKDSNLSILPETICELIGLRYLGLRKTCIQELPSSLGRLKSLEVLDIAKIKELKVLSISVICKMDSLRHLYMNRNITAEGSVKRNTLTNLQTLMGISIRSSMLVDLAKITSLRKLGITLANKEDYDFSLENLVNVSQIKLRGKLETLPSVSYFPPNLSSLTLVKAALRENSVAVLEKLPKLLCLKLDSAYKGEVMSISDQGFRTLEVLILCGLKSLRTIQVNGGMTKLKHLIISDCKSLDKEQLPEKLRGIITTQL